MTKLRLPSVFGLLALVGMLLLAGAQGQGAEPKQVVYLVSDRNNMITKVEWAQDLNLGGAMLKRQAIDFRDIVQLWRDGARTNYIGGKLHRSFELPLLPNDVIVFGEMSEARAKVIEGLPEIAALKLVPDPKSKPEPSGESAAPVGGAKKPDVSSTAKPQAGTSTPASTAAQSEKSFSRFAWPAAALFAIIGVLVSWWRLKR